MSGPNESIDSVLKPQPIPWSVGSERRQIYDAAGDHVATMGNGFNSLAQDIANALLVVKSVNDNGDLAAGFTHAVQTLEREHDANVKNGIRYCELRKAIDAILRELRNEDEIGKAVNALPGRNEGAVAYLRAIANRIERAVEAANPNQHEGRID